MRNLWQHRAKTFIIGAIVALGVVVLIVGNSLINTATLGIQRAFIDNYTAHVMVSGIADGQVSIFGVQSVGGIEPTPTIPNAADVREFAESIPGVESVTPQITSFGILRLDDDRFSGEDGTAFSLLFGIEPGSYAQTFDNVQVLDGEYLAAGQEGVMVSRDRIEGMERGMRRALRDEAEERWGWTGIADPYRRWARESVEGPELTVGDQIRVTSVSSGGLPRIRVVPLAAIYEPISETEGVGTEFITYLDADTQRALQGLTVGRISDFDLDESATALLDLDADGLFGVPVGGGSEAAEPLSAGDPFADEDLFTEPVEQLDVRTFADDELDTILGDTSVRERASEIDRGAWQYLLLRLGDRNDDVQVIEELEAYFDENGLAATAGNWEAAAGPFATTADVIRTVFNIAVIVIGVVAVIIIMNTMVISVMERTSEIGTMRALGASRTVVWRMFLLETLSITFIFGGIGILVGSATVMILNLIGIEATNTFLQILFAGPELHPEVAVGSLFSSLAIVSVIGILAHLYPVILALRIQPIRAIQTE